MCFCWNHASLRDYNVVPLPTQDLRVATLVLSPGTRSWHPYPERRQVWSSNERYATLRTPSWSSQQGWHADATAGAWVASSMSGPILPLIYSMQVLESPRCRLNHPAGVTGRGGLTPVRLRLLSGRWPEPRRTNLLGWGSGKPLLEGGLRENRLWQRWGKPTVSA